MFGKFVFFICLILFFYHIFKNRKIAYKLTVQQMVLVLLTYFITVFFAFICIYYIGNKVANFFGSPFDTVIFIGIIIMTIAICRFFLWKSLNKMTNGILPNELK